MKIYLNVGWALTQPRVAIQKQHFLSLTEPDFGSYDGFYCSSVIRLFAIGIPKLNSRYIRPIVRA